MNKQPECGLNLNAAEDCAANTKTDPLEGLIWPSSCAQDKSLNWSSIFQDSLYGGVLEYQCFSLHYSQARLLACNKSCCMPSMESILMRFV